VVILIVEDEHFVAMSLAWQLEAAGHTVLGPASSIEKARLVAGEQRADIALVDIYLEGSADGSALARHLTFDLKIPTLFMTGQPRTARQYADLAIGVITKPFSAVDADRSLAIAEVVIQGGRPAHSVVPCALELFAR